KAPGLRTGAPSKSPNSRARACSPRAPPVDWRSLSVNRKEPTVPDLSRRGVIAGAAGLLAAPAVVHGQTQTAGVALVIGNSKYTWEASLPNVQRDAPDVAKRFRALGLQTELVQNAGRDAMRAAIDKFTTAARGAHLAAFYFAGHGASWDKDTYLVPA